MNPYGKWIEGKDAMTVVAETPGRMRELCARIGTEGMTRPWAQGKWTVRQIVSHLAQCEMIFGTRFRQAVTLDEYIIQLFDQDQWMACEPVPDDDRALEALCAMREWNLEFWRGLKETDWMRTFNHPERGVMTVRELLETVAGHDLNHLSQLETVVAGK
ncbi:MAG TPA: DinB family protein [Blastocatellia bacterium]|nr:DinB family protein [Blastocatellia bacterium]